MPGNALDGSKLIVSWNRYEQGLMKAHLMKCAYWNDINCFGDFSEVFELHRMLKRHGILKTTYNYDEIRSNQLPNLVNDIKKVIKENLKEYSNSNKWWYWINNDKETKFLTSFAMAIQDTKKRDTFFPSQIEIASANQNDGIERICFNKNSYISIPKLQLFTLATQLSRIGINCKTTAQFSNNMRDPITNDERNIPKKTITLIDTNNFLELYNNFNGVKTPLRSNFSSLNIGMDGVSYYTQLYQKLFDFALKKMCEDCISGKKLKLPEFTIPLGAAWGTELANYIFEALNGVLGKVYNRPFNKRKLCYKDLIKINFIDARDKNSNSIKLLEYLAQNQSNPEKTKNLCESQLDICDYTQKKHLFADNSREQYVIMAGDHCAFLGNEALRNGLIGGTRCTTVFNNQGTTVFNNQGNYNNSSMEGFNMKTDFHKFYGQGYDDDTGINSTKCGFDQNNGAWISNPEKLNMPTKYILHMNYQQDKMVEVDEKQNIFQEINNRPVSNNIKTVKKNRIIIR